MAFFLIMVATGWVWSEHMTEERVHFPEREREFQGEVKRGWRARIQERFKRGGVLVFILGLLGTSQWLSWPIRSHADFFVPLCSSTHLINYHVMASHIARILHSLAKYPFECGFYSQNMMHLTGNQLKEMFKAGIITLIHTKHDINP